MAVSLAPGPERKAHNLQICHEALGRLPVAEKQELPLLDAWLADLATLGIWRLRKTAQHGRLSLAGLDRRRNVGTPRLKGIKTGGRLIVGKFKDANGRPYVMLVNRSLKEFVSVRPETWKEGAVIYRVSPASGKKGSLGGESNWLAPGGGILLRIGDPQPVKRMEAP